MGEIGCEQRLDRSGAALCFDIGPQFAREPRIRTRAAADENMKTFDRILVLAARHLAGDHADIADIMLRAGMMAARQMDVDGRLEHEPRLDMRGDGLGSAL